jgi:hypothetical protein
MVFCCREPTKTVPVHFTDAGDHEAGADDSCVSTGEWGKESDRCRRLKPNSYECSRTYGRRARSP